MSRRLEIIAKGGNRKATVRLTDGTELPNVVAVDIHLRDGAAPFALVTFADARVVVEADDHTRPTIPQPTPEHRGRVQTSAPGWWSRILQAFGR